MTDEVKVATQKAVDEIRLVRAVPPFGKIEITLRAGKPTLLKVEDVEKLD